MKKGVWVEVLHHTAVREEEYFWGVGALKMCARGLSNRAIIWL